MLTWSRFFLLVFLISFAISALFSLLLLEELEEHASGGGSGRSSAGGVAVFRHSALPPSHRSLLLRRKQGLYEPKLRSRLRNQPGTALGDLHDDAVAAAAAAAADGTSPGTISGNNGIDLDTLTRMLEEADIDTESTQSWAEAHENEADDSTSAYYASSSSSLAGISLWSLFWQGFGVDLKDWNTDISQLNYTWSEPSQHSKQWIAHQQMRNRPANEAQESAHESSQAHGDSATAAVDSLSQAASMESAAFASLLAARQIPPEHAFSPRTPRPLSVLHDLKPQQGIAPFLSFSPDFQTVRLCLVHAFLDDAAGRDSRGDGLVEWFVRPADAFLFPQKYIASREKLKEIELKKQQEKQQQNADDATNPASTGLDDSENVDLSSIFSSFDLDAIFASFADPTSGRGLISNDEKRRVLVEGDWALSEFASVPGVIHAQASSNSAGGAMETDWVAVAYEELKEGSDEPGLDAVLNIHLFFNPTPDVNSATVNQASHGSRVSIVVPLPSLRLATALSLLPSRVDAPNAHEYAETIVYYSLRGDKRVFRAFKVEAKKYGDEWNLSWQPLHVGPETQRHSYISQTVAIQPYLGDSDSTVQTAQPTDYKIIASELNWSHGPVILASSLAPVTQNRWSLPTTEPKRARNQALHLQSIPPFSAAIYRSEIGKEEQSSYYKKSEPKQHWMHEQWICSKKAIGKYAPNYFPLSIHRGNEGSLSPLITAASASNKFVAFAQVPLITTVDRSGNFDPIEIVHLETDTVFTGLAFSADGTILAVCDNRQDVIILHREKSTIAGYNASIASAASPAKVDAASMEAPSNETADAASTEAPTTPPPNPPKTRHQWEVMMEVTLPRRIKQLSLLSIHIVDVPIRSEEEQFKPLRHKNAAQADPVVAARAKSALGTTPYLILFFQGGVVGSLQLQPINLGGDSNATSTNGSSNASSSGKRGHGSVNHEELLRSIFSLNVMERFVIVHWDLLLLLLVVLGWLVFSLPRFNRIANQAVFAQQQQQQQQQQPIMAVQGAVAPPRGLLRHLFGARQMHQILQQQGMAVPQQPPAAAPPANVLNPLNPLAGIARPASVAASSSSSSSSSSTSSSVPPASNSNGSSSSSSAVPQMPSPIQHTP